MIRKFHHLKTSSWRNSLSSTTLTSRPQIHNFAKITLSTLALCRFLGKILLKYLLKYFPEKYFLRILNIYADVWIRKRGSRGVAHVAISPWWSVKKSLKCLYEDKVILLRIAIFMPKSALGPYLSIHMPLWIEFNQSYSYEFTLPHQFSF